MGEVDRDAVLRRRNDLPDAVLARWVEIRKGRTLNCPVGSVDDSSTGICNERGKSPLVTIAMVDVSAV